MQGYCFSYKKHVEIKMQGYYFSYEKHVKKYYIVEYESDSCTCNVDYALSKILTEQDVEDISKKFNNFIFKNKKDAKKCVDYLNEAYGLILYMIKFSAWDQMEEL